MVVHRRRQQRRDEVEPIRSSDARSLLYRARLSAFRGEAIERPTDLDVSEQLFDMIREAASVYAASVSDQTRADYMRRWRRFEEWCDDNGLDALPAESTTVMAYLTERRTSASLSTLRGVLAAISRIHFEAGLPPPRSDPALGVFMQGLSRTTRTEPLAPQISALRVSDLREVCAALDAASHDPRRVRDRCALMLWGCGLDCTEMAHLRWDGVKVRSKGVDLYWLDSQGVVQSRSRLRASDGSDPLPAIAAWRDVTPAPETSVFVRVDANGAVKQSPLRASEVSRIVDVNYRALSPDDARRPGEIDVLMQGEPARNLRDKALLLLGFAGAFRRKELTDLVWSDIEEVDEGLKVRLRRSKTDRTGRGAIVGIPRGRSHTTCPVDAMAAWRLRVEQHGLGDGDRAVFVPVTRGGQLEGRPMTPEVVTRVVESRAAMAGVPGHWAGRSLRAGFITTAADMDIPLDLIARQSRHATLDNLVRYIRHEDPFRRNAADWIGM